MPSRTLHKPVPDGTYIVEWAKFIGPREHPELKEWVMDVGRIEGDWFRSFDGKIRKKVSSEYFLVKRRIRKDALNMPGECSCRAKRRQGEDDMHGLDMPRDYVPMGSDDADRDVRGTGRTGSISSVSTVRSAPAEGCSSMSGRIMMGLIVLVAIGIGVWGAVDAQDGDRSSHVPYIPSVGRDHIHTHARDGRTDGGITRRRQKGGAPDPA